MNKIQDLMPIVNAKIISNGSGLTYEIEIVAPNGDVVDKVKHISKVIHINRQAVMFEIRIYVDSLKKELCKRFNVAQKDIYLKGSIYDA